VSNKKAGRKVAFTLIASIILIITLFILINQLLAPKTELLKSIEVNDILSGDTLNLKVKTSNSVNQVSLELRSPSNEASMYSLTKQGNEWVLGNALTLTEVGLWQVKVTASSRSGESVRITTFRVGNCVDNNDCEEDEKCVSNTCVELTCSPCEKKVNHECVNACEPGQLCCETGCFTLVCESNSDCDDGDVFTIDTCVNPGTCGNACQNVRKSCDEGEVLCFLGNESFCQVPFCSVDSDCSDGKHETKDVCVNPNSCTAHCEFIEVNCESPKIPCNGTCVAPTCSDNSDCDDENDETNDFCDYAGTCDSTCVHCNTDEVLCEHECVKPECFTDSDCDDSKSSTNDYCARAGTCFAACVHCNSDEILCNNECFKPCTTHAECADDDPSTNDYCDHIGENSCESKCIHEPIT